MATIINLTPHVVTVLSSECCEYNPRTRGYTLTGDPIVLRTIESSGTPVRCAVTELDGDTIDGIPTARVAFGNIEGLPDEEAGTYYVVSAIAANAGREKGRRDLLVPARVVRDSEGKVVGCLALATN